MDRGLETGRASVWLEEDRAMTIGERTPLYLEIYDDGEGVGIPPLPAGSPTWPISTSTIGHTPWLSP